MKTHNPTFAWLVCGLGAVFYCYEYLLRILPSVITTDLMRTFHIDATALGNLAAVYYYAYVPMQLPVGVLVDKFGPKKLLVIAALICAVGSFLFTNQKLPAAQLGRFLIGFGSAFAFISVMKLATLWLPRSQFALAVGLVMTLSMLGVVSGDIILSKLVAMLGWPDVVYFLAVIGILIAALIAFIIPRKEDDSFTSSAKTLTSSFKHVLPELAHLVKKPQLWLIGIVGCLLYLPLSMFAELWAVPYLVRVHGFNNVLATKITAMIFLGMALGSPLIGLISSYIKKRVVLMIISASLASITALLIIYLPKIDTAYYYFYIIFFTLGIFTAGQTLVFTLAREFSSDAATGTAIAMVNMLVMAGGMLFQPLIGHLLDKLSPQAIVGNLNTYSAQDFHYALLVLPISIFISMLILLCIREPTFTEA